MEVLGFAGPSLRSCAAAQLSAQMWRPQDVEGWGLGLEEVPTAVPCLVLPNSRVKSPTTKPATNKTWRHSSGREQRADRRRTRLHHTSTVFPRSLSEDHDLGLSQKKPFDPASHPACLSQKTRPAHSCRCNCIASCANESSSMVQLAKG